MLSSDETFQSLDPNFKFWILWNRFMKKEIVHKDAATAQETEKHLPKNLLPSCLAKAYEALHFDEVLAFLKLKTLKQTSSG